MYQAFLVKYGEIGLKGNNRHIFENALKNRIMDSLRPLGEYTVVREQGRIFVECPQGYDYEDTVEALGRVFGVTGFCPVKVVETTDWETVKQATGDFVEEMYPQKNFTFKVAAKRADKQYRVNAFYAAFYVFSNRCKHGKLLSSFFQILICR